MIELDKIDHLEEDVLEDVEPYEGSPIYVQPVDVHGAQDDEAEYPEPESSAFMPREIAGLLSKISEAPNTWRETLDWYKSHRTQEAIGFDPDGMCLKICRTARGIPAKYLTARDAMLATPAQFRHFQINQLRRGMVAYYADPYDSNPADHIVTVLGRVKDFDPNDLNDVLMLTNSVQANRLTVVRGTYFEQHWGDDFKFGATWLNGYELDVPFKKAVAGPVEDHGAPVKDKETKIERFHDTAPEYNLRLLERANRPVGQRILDQIEAQVRRLPNNPDLHRVAEFKLKVKDDRILDLRLLNQAIAAGRVGLVKKVHTELVRLIQALPDE